MTRERREHKQVCVCERKRERERDPNLSGKLECSRTLKKNID